MDASILNLAHHAGYPTLVLLIMAESAGIPLPGETALITAAILAGQHRLQIVLVIALAAAAAIVGDNLGYLVGRKGGRWLLQRPGPFARHRAHVLEIGEPFFARHGPKAVFLGRWILGLRTWASWLAGANRMPWRSFSLWNATGAITWAAAIGILADYLGHSAAGTAALFGVAGVIGALAIPGAISLARRRRRDQRQPPPESNDQSQPPSDATASRPGSEAPLDELDPRARTLTAAGPISRLDR
jgi:membrane protein DedA with SNARE-associated domain